MKKIRVTLDVEISDELVNYLATEWDYSVPNGRLDTLVRDKVLEDVGDEEFAYRVVEEVMYAVDGQSKFIQ